jgi:hypothetical protein
MLYRITKPFVGYRDFIEISCDEYQVAKVAKRNLLEVLHMEEKFNLMIENYAEFERELLELSLNHSIFSDHDWFSFQIDRHRLNRRLINLLTTFRLYVDQIPHNLNSIYGKSAGLAEVIKRRMSDEYDSSLSYRVVEALRNYVQHRGLPIYGLQYRSTLIENSPSTFIKHTITPSLSVSRLKDEKGFKATVLKELETIGDQVDIMPFIRQYVDSLGRVHVFLRETLADDIAKWDAAIFEVQDRFHRVIGDDIKGLAVEEYDSAGKLIESVQIVSEIIEQRQLLVRKNQSITRFSSNIITNELRDRDA